MARPTVLSRLQTTAALSLVLLFGSTQCSVNPATGQRELSLVSEAQEIAMGREADPAIVAQFGLYPDDDLQRYVQDLGQRLAAESERPHLPWTFRVLDDPLVNAFALPGGFIYVTRGIMAHLDSEAELVGVLGHEIGHVTARHGASQMSKAMLANIGFGLSAVLAPEATQAFGGLAQGLAGLLFLKYGRDDEKQADALGVRYALRTGHDPRELIDVFETLGRVSAAAGAGGMPAWASTHPAPENRAVLINQRVAQLNQPLDGLTVDRDEYWRRMDGVVFGSDPRQGFFIGSRFYHPEMAFVLDFPEGWQTVNQRSRVAALSPQQNALMDLTLAQGETPQAAGERFYSQSSIRAKGNWRRVTTGFRGLSRVFGVDDQQGAEVIEGMSNFVQDGERVYQLLGYGKASDRSVDWRGLERSLQTMRRLSNRKILDVQPRRLDVVRVRRDTRAEDLMQIAGDLTLEELLLINRLDAGEIVAAGTEIRVARGFNPANGLP